MKPTSEQIKAMIMRKDWIPGEGLYVKETAVLWEAVEHPFVEGYYLCIVWLDARDFRLIMTNGKNYFQYGHRERFKTIKDAKRRLRYTLKVIDKAYEESDDVGKVMESLRCSTQKMHHFYMWKPEQGLFSRITFNKKNHRWHIRRYHGNLTEDGKFVYHSRMGNSNGDPSQGQSVGTLEEALWYCAPKGKVNPPERVKARKPAAKVETPQPMGDEHFVRLFDDEPVGIIQENLLEGRAANVIAAKVVNAIANVVTTHDAAAPICEVLGRPDTLRGSDLVRDIVAALKPYLCEDCVKRLEGERS